MSVLRVVLVLGTRPEAIKLSPLIRAMKVDPRFRPVVVATAQHREMLDQVLDLFEIKPEHDLNLCSPGQTLEEITAHALLGLRGVLEQERPDVVVVQGDTTSTFVGALAAFYAMVPVVHVEAGLRTGLIRSPFPEEANRRLTAQLTDLHLAPTSLARDNLTAEQVPEARIVVTGNTCIDALFWALETRAPYGNAQIEDLDDDPRRVVVVTAHRRESWGGIMSDIGQALGLIAERYPDVRIVFPIHRNPAVRASILSGLGQHSNVDVIEPLPYAGMARLVKRARVVLTDSGGLQEEAPSLGVPVLVMRDTTERPEGIAAGTAKLVGTNTQRIFDNTVRLLDDTQAYLTMSRAINPYGDGRSAGRCIEAIASHFGRAFGPGGQARSTTSDDGHQVPSGIPLTCIQ